MENFLNKIDFHLLSKQKNALLKEIEKNALLKEIETVELLEGILVLIDSLQDEAVDNYDFKENEVFTK